MAKRKDDDDFEFADEPQEALEAEEAPLAEEEALPADEALAVEQEAEEVQQAAGDDRGDEDALVAEEAEPEPAPAVTTLTLVLCVLNILAVLGFAFLLIKDLGARQGFTRAAFLHELAIQGLPLEEDAGGPNVVFDVPARTLDPAWLAAAFKQRQTGKNVSEPFQMADYRPQKIRPQDMSDDVLRELLKDNPRPTLDEEIKRLKDELPRTIDNAASGAKDAKDPRERLYEYLTPLAATSGQGDELDDAIRAVPANQLADLLSDAYRRRVLTDLLTLLEDFRPWDAPDKTEYILEGTKDHILRDVIKLTPGKGPLTNERFVVKIDDLQKVLGRRVDELLADKDVPGRERTALEKRRSIGFFLFALTRLKQPDGNPLYPPERAEVVSGLREFTIAADTMVLVMERGEKRLLAVIERDRGQYTYPFEYRVHNPEQFAKAVLDVLERLQVPVPDKAGFLKQAKDEFTAQLGKFRPEGPGKPAEKQVLKSVKDLLAKSKITITEDKGNVGLKVKETAFEREILRLVDSREMGFAGQHQEAVQRLSELVALLEEQKIRLKEVQDQERALKEQFDERDTQVNAARKKLLDARAMTMKLANNLYRLQEQVVRAQVELADADLRNQIMERRIRAIELRGRKR
ncbi:MAG: hypothetical protein L0Z62_18990 [Gemmataceae bacterium]|nr:hypothetical protein [Gemmataceae bacterium]